MTCKKFGAIVEYVILVRKILLTLFCRSFLENSYHDEALRNFISSSLAPTGIFAAHVGEAPDGNSPTEEYSYFKYRHQLIGNLSMVGFESIRDYEEVCLVFIC